VTTPRYCRDCTYVRPDTHWTLIFQPKERWRFAVCVAPPQPVGGDELVNPLVATRAEFCSIARSFERLCGQDAKWFEPR